MRETGEISLALPVHTFYPIPMAQAEDFLHPDRLKRTSFGADTVAVHLWGSKLRKVATADFGGRIHPRFVPRQGGRTPVP